MIGSFDPECILRKMIGSFNPECILRKMIGLFDPKCILRKMIGLFDPECILRKMIGSFDPECILRKMIIISHSKRQTKILDHYWSENSFLRIYNPLFGGFSRSRRQGIQ